MAVTENDVYQIIRGILIDALGVEEEDVRPEARLTDDLGAESIDYLDIFFQIEKKLGVRIEVNEQVVSTLTTDERFVRESAITDEGMAELRRQLPNIDLRPLEESRDVRRFTSVFTVQGLVDMVRSRLADDINVA